MKRAGVEVFRRREGMPPRIVGHRGVRREGGPPENTLAAFEAAAAEGARAVELDVRVSSNGEAVVMHDPTLDRMTLGRDTRAVAELSTRELARVDLGGGASAPTLVEALAIARSLGLAVNIEMKRDAPNRLAVVRAVARVIAAWDPRHALLVSSFDPWMLGELAALDGDIDRALLVNRTWYARIAALDVGPWLSHALHIERTIASPELVRALRARGAVVSVWTVNHPAEARDLAALGVDGLITDVPADLAAAF